MPPFPGIGSQQADHYSALTTPCQNSRHHRQIWDSLHIITPSQGLDHQQQVLGAACGSRAGHSCTSTHLWLYQRPARVAAHRLYTLKYTAWKALHPQHAKWHSCITACHPAPTITDNKHKHTPKDCGQGSHLAALPQFKLPPSVSTCLQSMWDRAPLHLRIQLVTVPAATTTECALPSSSQRALERW